MATSDPVQKPARDPFAPPPPVDAETLELEAALRRRGMRFGILMMVLGTIAVLLALLGMLASKRWSSYIYLLGLSCVLFWWGFTYFLKYKQREY